MTSSSTEELTLKQSYHKQPKSHNNVMSAGCYNHGESGQAALTFRVALYCSSVIIIVNQA